MRQCSINGEECVVTCVVVHQSHALDAQRLHSLLIRSILCGASTVVNSISGFYSKCGLSSMCLVSMVQKTLVDVSSFHGAETKLTAFD